MSRPLEAGLLLVSKLLRTISCVPPPRVTGNEEATGRRNEEWPVDALFAPLPEPEST